MYRPSISPVTAMCAATRYRVTLQNLLAGVTFRKWLGVNPYLVNGTSEYDLEIDIDWSLVSASSFYLAWTGRFGGGGTLTVTNTHLETPTFIVRYYNECCTDILFETDIIDDATNYYWEITGFNDDPDDETTSGNTWQTNVNDPGGAGTVKVKGYFGGGCNKYGGQKTIVYN